MIDNKKLLGNDNDIFQIKEVLEKSLDNKWTQEFVYLLRKFFYIEYWSNVEKNERYTIQMIQEVLKKHLDFLDEDRGTEEVMRKFRAMLPYLQQLVISDIYADALYKETKILQYLNHSLSKKVLGYLYENANATILEIGAGTGATSDKVLSDIRENKFEEHIVYFYTDISRFFLQRAKERYKECDGKIEMHYQTLDIDEAFSSQLPSNFQADIVIAVGVLNNSVNTDKCIYEINSVMKPGGILLIIETVEDVPDILITQSFMMTEPKDQRKATNTMFLNRKQWLEILEENGFCNSEEFPGYGEYLEVLGQKLFYCTKE